MKRILSLAAALTVAFAAIAANKEYKLCSPDGELCVIINAGEDISYSIEHKGDCLLAPSVISMTLEDGTVYGGGQKFKAISKNEEDNNELTLKFKAFSLIFKAFDNGIAYRFVSHAKAPFKVLAEQAQFVFPQDNKAYIPYVRNIKNFENEPSVQFFSSFENQYVYSEISKWENPRYAFLPVLIEAGNGRKLCITETDLYDYPGMYLSNPDNDSSLEALFAPFPKTIEQGGHNMLQGLVKERENYIAKYEGATSFPWRIIAVSESDEELLANELSYRLAPPADPETDFSWVKPGKVAWEWWHQWNISGVDFESGINNDTYKYYIDFASLYGIEYVILDEGWAVNLQADLMQVVPEINLPELVAYANERNVGLILWAGYWAFDMDMENVCRHYSEMGIKGFKVDFMDRDDQMMVAFHRRAAETAAKYKLMLDFHGTYKPVGLHRTYPNVVNYEGVFGLEQMKWNSTADQVEYDVLLPFIRMVAGPMDYTQGAMRNASKKNFRAVYNEPMSQGTRCRQLAEYVVFNAPLNMLCDSPSAYMKEAECTAFMAAIPTVWDELVPLKSVLGEYVAVAKRSGDSWYVAAMTDWSERDVELELSFLGEEEWQMESFADGRNAHKIASDYRLNYKSIDTGKCKTLKVHLAPGGGFIARFSK